MNNTYTINTIYTRMNNEYKDNNSYTSFYWAITSDNKEHFIEDSKDYINFSKQYNESDIVYICCQPGWYGNNVNSLEFDSEVGLIYSSSALTDTETDEETHKRIMENCNYTQSIKDKFNIQ